MAFATQSTKPTKFMPRLRNYLADELELPPTEVKIATDESGDPSPHSVEDRSVMLSLQNPAAVNVNAGAGRRGFPLTRVLLVKVRTRGGLDAAGEDDIALAAHWDLQDEIINALLVLPHTEDKDGLFPFVGPVQFVGQGQGDVKRIKNTSSGYESVLPFLLKYVPEVEVP
jgi:hypothetical protein